MSSQIRKSNFDFIEVNFSDIILEIRSGVDGILSDARDIRKTIVFRDMSKMHCHEHLNDDKTFIELYWYDWYDDKKELVMKFHAHYHPDGTPAKITQYDPFHIHVGYERHPNNNFRELNEILEFIRLRQLSLNNP